MEYGLRRYILTSIFVLAAMLAIQSAAKGSGKNSKHNYELPKREFRGAWIHTVGNKQMRTMSVGQIKEMFVKTLDSLKLAGCNAVIFQVRPTADALYRSDLEPWSRYLTGVQGKAPEDNWDPLAFMIEESHKRGMELHAWCNPYRVTSEETDTLCAEHIYFKNPEIFVKHGKQIYFNPCEPASREHTVKVISDIVTRYDVDAIHFDDYFYPYPIEGEEFDDEAAFKKYGPEHGFTLPEQKADWRRYNVTLLIKELNHAIKKIKPWVRFGISPFGIHRNKKDTPDGSGSETNGLSNYEQLYADVPLWVENGYIDYNVPQIYWKIGHPKADYDILIHWWNNNTPKGHFYVGQSISTFKEPDLVNPKTTQMKRKMELVRELPNVHGNVWWPGWSIVRNSHNIADSLIKVYQKYPALVPAYTDLDRKTPHPLTDIAKDGRVIRWKQSERDAQNPMQRALFYIVYCFPEGVKPDLQNSKYIVKITDRMEYNVVEENENHGAGCKYAVTAVDRCWNESAPSKILWY
ncbi:MAG: family 10 glycosylhydrolase [Bacteroidales bacterium]|nr:family 10 glycosylhydrolase [Bacteroidales bacterium]